MAGKVGINQPPPGPNPDEPGLPDWADWARNVEVDVEALRSYATAVYTATGEYLASITDEDLGRSIDLSAIGLGENSVGQLLGVLLSNAQWHTGEIACLKGVQGSKGYPFLNDLTGGVLHKMFGTAPFFTPTLNQLVKCRAGELSFNQKGVKKWIFYTKLQLTLPRQKFMKL